MSPSAPAVLPVPYKGSYTSVLFSQIKRSGGSHEVIQKDSLWLDSPTMQRTSSSADDYLPRYSRDGARVVFVSERDGAPEIYLLNLLTGAEMRLTANSAIDTMPTFSPDGSRIAFVSDISGNPDLWVMNTDGTSLQRLTSAKEPDVTPDWSPDGTRIAFVRIFSRGANQVLTIHPDGGAETFLRQVNYGYRPFWSPDGSKFLLMFDSDNNGWYDLGEMSADGASLSVLNMGYAESLAARDLWSGNWMEDGQNYTYGAVDYVSTMDNDGKYYWALNGGTIYTTADFPFTATQGLVAGDYEHLVFDPYTRSLDETPPVVTLSPLPEYASPDNLKVSYSVTDNYSQPFSLTITTRTDPASSWSWSQTTKCDDSRCQNWIGEMYASGPPGAKVILSASAVDRANNTIPAASQATLSTWIYQWAVTLHLADARGYPLEGMRVDFSPAAMNQPQKTGAGGKANFYFPVTGRFSPSSDVAAYTGLEQTLLTIDGDKDYRLNLTGTDEQVNNGRFDEQLGALSGWSSAGDLAVRPGKGRIDDHSASIGSTCGEPLCLDPAVETVLNGAAGDLNFAGYDAQNRLHVVIGASYFIRDSQGQYHRQADLPCQPSTFQLDGAGQGYCTSDMYSGSAQRVYRYQGDHWSNELLPVLGKQYVLQIDALGQYHLTTFEDIPSLGDSTTLYYRRMAQGGWLDPITLPIPAGSTYMDMRATSTGDAYLVFRGSPTYYNAPLPYFLVKVGTSMAPSTPEVVENGVQREYRGAIYLWIAPDDTIYLIFPDVPLLVKKRSPGGAWQDILDPSLAEQQYPFSVDSTQLDRQGNLLIMTFGFQGEAYSYPALFQLPINGGKGKKWVNPSSFITDHFTKLVIDPDGGYTFIKFSVVNAQPTLILGRVTTAIADEAGGLTQHINLPSGMKMPTLAFDYHLDAPIGSQSTIQVIFTPDGGSPVTLKELPAQDAAWTHAWVEMSGYLGQSGVLAFHINQAGGEFLTTLLVDDVTLASWPTPVVTGAQLADDGWIHVTGMNFQSGAQVKYKGVLLTGVEISDPGHLRFKPLAGFSLGDHLVLVINPGGAVSPATVIVRTGIPTFLPILTRAQP